MTAQQVAEKFKKTSFYKTARQRENLVAIYDLLKYDAQFSRIYEAMDSFDELHYCVSPLAIARRVESSSHFNSYEAFFYYDYDELLSAELSEVIDYIYDIFDDMAKAIETADVVTLKEIDSLL